MFSRTSSIICYKCDISLTASSLSLTHESCPVQRPAIFLIKGVDVGSFSEEEVHHLTERKTEGGEISG